MYKGGEVWVEFSLCKTFGDFYGTSCVGCNFHIASPSWSRKRAIDVSWETGSIKVTGEEIKFQCRVGSHPPSKLPAHFPRDQ